MNVQKINYQKELDKLREDLKKYLTKIFFN